jgi:hypothetical protein
MGSKVRKIAGKWVVVTHFGGKCKHHTVGPSQADKRVAQKIAEQINARIALGEFRGTPTPPEGVMVGQLLRQWHDLYQPTFKPSFERSSKSMIDRHLVPFFGPLDVRDVSEDTLLVYIREKLRAGLAPTTITTQLSVLRRVLELATRDELIARNPAGHLGELMRRVGRRSSDGVKQAAP